MSQGNNHRFKLLVVLEIVSRVLIGGLFIYAAIGKLLEPREEFEAVIRTYEILPDSFVSLFAMALPWFELLAGLFMVIGLWSRLAALGIGLVLVSFIIAIGVNIARGNEIDCGCFGTFSIGNTPRETLLKDVGLLALTVLLASRKRWRWTMDGLLSGSDNGLK
ncbi:MAG: MauE/DoxX family redox-associated membrane protein [bacterium]